MNTLPFYSAAIELIREAIAPAGTVEVGRSPDATVSGDLRVRTGAGERAHVVELKPWHGKPEKSRLRRESSLVWILTNAPPELVRRLRTSGENFVDVKRGVVRLAIPRLLIDRTDLEPPPVALKERGMLDPFGDRASLVARTIVRWPGRTWTTRALATAAGVSTMTASHVVRQLADTGALDVQRNGRANSIRLRSLRNLIERWVLQYDWQRNPRLSAAAPVGDSHRFLLRLPAILKGTRWALTMQAGASLVAPIAAWDTIHVYVDVESERALDTVARRANWPIGDGKVVLMKPWYTESLWFDVEKHGGLPVVSRLQLMLDLWRYPVRGLEQAEHLLESTERRERGAGLGDA